MDRRAVLIGLGGLSLAGCGGVASPPRSAAIQTLDLSSLEARHGGRLGFVIQDTADDRILTWRGEERFVYCSTFKAYLAAATLLRIQAGAERLDRLVPISRDDMVPHAPVTGPAVGGGLTVEVLMKATVEISDNPAANVLIREMGGLAAFRDFYRNLEDTTTTVDRYEPEMNRAEGDKDTILPLQSVRNLRRLLVDGDTPLSPASKALLMRWMVETPTGLDRIRGGIPAGWTVAHKTGTGGYGPTNDIGVIFPPGRAPIVIAVYFYGPSHTTDAQNAAVIAQTTRSGLSELRLV